MTIISSFRQINLQVAQARTYLLGVLFVAGNLILPQICHLMPEGGKIFLPIYFFTLIAGYKFGFQAGLLTAVLSPLCNYWLFGMPALAVLPVLLIKSALLAVAAAWVARKTKQLSLLHIALVVLAYQFTGGLAEWGITGEWGAAVQDFRLGYPGMIAQIVLGWLVLKCMAE